MPIDQLLLSAARITWRRRFLWALGLLVASGGLLFNLILRGLSWFSADNLSLEKLTQTVDLGSVVSPWTLIAGVVVLFLLGLLSWLVSSIAEGGLIVAVRQISVDESANLGRALLALALLLVGFAGLGGMVVVATRTAAQAADLFLVAGLSTLVSLPILLLMLLTGVVIMVLRTLAFRAAAVQEMGARESIGQSWRVLRQNTLQVVVMAVILWAIRSLAGMPLRMITLALAGVTLTSSLLAAADQVADAGGTNWLAISASFILALLSWLVSGIMSAYGSTSWTLAYDKWTGDLL
jgi:hypothetical protein